MLHKISLENAWHCSFFPFVERSLLIFFPSPLLPWPLQVTSRSETHAALNTFRRKSGAALVITGAALEVTLHEVWLSLVGFILVGLSLSLSLSLSLFLSLSIYLSPLTSPFLTLFSVFHTGLPSTLRERVCWACVPVSGSGRLPMFTRSESSNCTTS